MKLSLPEHPARRFPSVGRCIYCGRKEGLSDEHIVPYAAGGRWILPRASCKACAAITATFEGGFARTILGPLRMLYDMPTRRPKQRPRHLPLKVKYPGSTDWEVAQVDRSICPFLVTLPLYPLPQLLTGVPVEGEQGAAASRFWIRGGGFWPDKDAHMEWLCQMLGATHVMPIATLETVPFCLTILKVAHAFAVAELGGDAFDPFLPDFIRNGNLANRAMYLGGGEGDEAASENTHDVGLIGSRAMATDIVAVSVRLFGILETPTYQVAVGRRR